MDAKGLNPIQIQGLGYLFPRLWTAEERELNTFSWAFYVRIAEYHVAQLHVDL